MLIDDERRRVFIDEMNRVNGCLGNALAEMPLDQEHVARLSGFGISLLLGLAVELLGGDSEATEDPRQLPVFPDWDLS
jgi:hypothetical protein